MELWSHIKRLITNYGKKNKKYNIKTAQKENYILVIYESYFKEK